MQLTRPKQSAPKRQTICVSNNILKTKNLKEGNVLFNDALNTFYLRLYGIRHMVKDHSDSERKPAPATWAILFD